MLKLWCPSSLVILSLFSRIVLGSGDLKYLSPERLIHVLPGQTISVCGTYAQSVAQEILEWAKWIHRDKLLKVDARCNRRADAVVETRFRRDTDTVCNSPGLRAWANAENSSRLIIVCMDDGRIPQHLIHETGHVWGLCDQYSNLDHTGRPGHEHCDPDTVTSVENESIMGNEYILNWNIRNRTAGDVYGIRRLSWRHDIKANQTWAEQLYGIEFPRRSRIAGAGGRRSIDTDLNLLNSLGLLLESAQAYSDPPISLFSIKSVRLGSPADRENLKPNDLIAGELWLASLYRSRKDSVEVNVLRRGSGGNYRSAEKVKMTLSKMETSFFKDKRYRNLKRAAGTDIVTLLTFQNAGVVNVELYWDQKQVMTLPCPFRVGYESLTVMCSYEGKTSTVNYQILDGGKALGLEELEGVEMSPKEKLRFHLLG